jgi:tetratricopeptide (TPR) repeat protein
VIRFPPEDTAGMGHRSVMKVWLCAVTILAACGRTSPLTDSDLDRDPDYQQARKTAETGDFRTAAELYERVVRAAPDAARGHLELGLLYDEKMGDPIAAIYHYRQYLALRPDSEKKPVVEDYIERCKLTLAAKLPQSTGIDPAELTRLQMENATLRTQMSELQTHAAAVPAEAATPVTPAASGETHTHVVQKGDTLQSLALRYYGTRSSWEKIFAANRTILPSKDQLKVGQQLVIP